MPVGVRSKRAGESGKPFKIVKLVDGKPTGAVEGESDTRPAALASARFRNQATEKSAESLVIRLSGLEKAASKVEGGQRYPAAAYAYVPDREKPSTWKLRLWDSPQEKETPAQVARAAQALGSAGFRGRKVQIPAADLAGVKRKVLAAWLRTHPKASRADAPAALKRAAESGPIYLSELAKFAARTSRDRGHFHALDLPDKPQAGTFPTKKVKTPGDRDPHLHVLVVRPGAREGQVIVTSPGPDGHVHRVKLGAGRTSVSAR